MCIRQPYNISNGGTIASLFAFPLLAIRAFFTGTTNTKILTANSLIMVVCNIGFNYLLIFGKAGFPKLGISGAAIGSSLAGLGRITVLSPLYEETHRQKTIWITCCI